MTSGLADWRPGIVASVEGDRARVRLDRPSACRQCAQGAGCGIGPLTTLFGARQADAGLQVPARGLRVGDRVCVGVSPQALLRAVAIAYLLPLLALFGGAAAAAASIDGGGDLPAVCGAAAGLVAGRILARRMPFRGGLRLRAE